MWGVEADVPGLVGVVKRMPRCNHLDGTRIPLVSGARVRSTILRRLREDEGRSHPARVQISTC